MRHPVMTKFHGRFFTFLHWCAEAVVFIRKPVILKADPIMLWMYALEKCSYAGGKQCSNFARLNVR